MFGKLKNKDWKDIAGKILDKGIKAMSPKQSWEFTDQEAILGNIPLRRIRAIRTFPIGNRYFKAGTLGGWISQDTILEPESWVADDAIVIGKSFIGNGVLISGRALVVSSRFHAKETIVEDNATVAGISTFQRVIASGNNCAIDKDWYWEHREFHPYIDLDAKFQEL
jgi:hypothetical protein